jgi:PAS domain S-box-containing protein
LQYLIRLITDVDRLAEMSAAARRDAIRFDIAHHVRSLHALYRKLLRRDAERRMHDGVTIDRPRNPEPDIPLAASATGDPEEMRMYTELLEYTHDAIIIWEIGSAGIVYWNRAAEQLYGYGRAEVHGKTIHTLLKTKLIGGVNQLESYLARFGVWIGELHHTTRDGRLVTVEARLALMSQRNGRWLVLEVNRDISDRVAAEATRRALARQLEQWRALQHAPRGS